MDVTSYLKGVCQHCGLAEDDCTVTIEENDERVAIQLDVPQDDVGLFIGHRGETLNALQRMIRIIFRDKYADQHVILNINDYRDSRQEQLKEKALEAAEEVLETEEPFQFNYLSSYERYLVHKTIAEDGRFEELISVSEGKGRGRRLVVRYRTEEDENVQPVEETKTFIDDEDINDESSEE